MILIFRDFKAANSKAIKVKTQLARCGFAFRCLLIYHPHTINVNVCSYGAITTKTSTREACWPRSARKPRRFVKKKWRLKSNKGAYDAVHCCGFPSAVDCLLRSEIYERRFKCMHGTATFYESWNFCKKRTTLDWNSLKLESEWTETARRITGQQSRGL